ncbi:MAG: hypothetical protein U1F36_16290 [Planctomycetota bacterium]
MSKVFLRHAVQPIAIVFLMVSALVAQSRDERRVNVGMRAHIDQLVLPGTRLVAKPADDPKAPIVLRVLQTWPHGTEFRYDLEWVPFVAGKHDLREFLVRADGSSTEDLPKIEVFAESVISPLRIEPNDLAPVTPPSVGGYHTLITVAIVVWVVGLGLILFVGRRRARAAATASAPLTLADRLRPMVEDAMYGRLGPDRRADLERLLLAHWRERLDLGGERTAQAVAKLRAHPEAGALLRQLEDWLHRPEPLQQVDLQALLAPYREVGGSGPGKPA